MKIAWFCIPAHGHTNPTLGLVRALTDAGHEVFYFSFEMFREKIENAGATFIACDGYDFEMEDKENADRVGKDQAFAVELLVSSTLALDEMVTEHIARIRPDLIVSDSVAYWGKLAAMKHRIPYVSSTTTFAFNRYSSRYMKHGLGETMRMLFSMPKVNKQIRRLQEKGYPVKGLLDIVQNDNDTNTIVYTSRYFQPCSETFSEKYRFIGPSMRPITEPCEKTAAQTVYISMGTVNQNREFYRNCIEALGKTPYQVILSMGTNPDRFEALPDNVRLLDEKDPLAAEGVSADLCLRIAALREARRRKVTKGSWGVWSACRSNTDIWPGWTPTTRRWIPLPSVSWSPRPIPNASHTRSMVHTGNMPFHPATVPPWTAPMPWVPMSGWRQPMSMSVPGSRDASTWLPRFHPTSCLPWRRRATVSPGTANGAR